ncbi:MAG: hypothetical protein K0B15_11565 [Lentimicrobium sp.]|nr:hypothetical protein [Lentimicrobium sp.]
MACKMAVKMFNFTTQKINLKTQIVLTKSLFTILFLLSSFLCQEAISQETCRVLKPSIDGSYTGKCKKGLASGKGIANGIDHYEGQFIKGLPHGKGIYTWSTGEVYNGSWEKGKRHGEGSYSFFFNGNDTVSVGMWINDRYAGPVVRKPMIISNTGVERYTIRKYGDINKRVLVGFYQNGSPNSGISELFINANSGYQVNLGPLIGYEGIVFPVTFKISYTTFNKLRTATHQVRFEFEIYEEGDWRVDLIN